MVFKLLRLYLKETWNSRTVAFLILMLALTALLSSDIPASQEGKADIFNPIRLSVVDDDQSLISFTLVDQFSSLAIVDKVYVESLAEAQARLKSNEILLIMVIPDGFYEQTTQGVERSGLTVYLNEKMPAEATVFVRLLNNATGSVEGIQSALFAFQDAMRPLFQDPAAFQKSAEVAAMNMAFRLVGRKTILKIADDVKLNTVWYVISALTCLLAMLTGLIVLMQVQQERLSGMHERLLIANIPWWQVMLAKKLTGLIWLLAGFAPLLAALSRFYPGLRLWPVILAIGLIYWITATLCLVLGYLGRPGETMLLAAWLGLLTILLLGGCIYPLQLLPGWLQPITLISPARWAFALIYGSLAQQPFSLMAAAILVVMIPCAIAGSWLSWRKAKPGT